MGKPTMCIGENKDADQLRGNLYQSSVTVLAGLCRTWSEPKLLIFLKHRLNSKVLVIFGRCISVCIAISSSLPKSDF